MNRKRLLMIKYRQLMLSANTLGQLFLFVVILFFSIILVSCTQKKSLPDPLKAGWNNQPVCEVLEDNLNLRVLKCTFPPGVGHEKHYHDTHFGYTIAGSRFRIKDTTGTREVDVPTGSNFSNDGIEWHEVLNIGDSTAIFLIIEHK
jgi:quercetin dioxygenase-like cupin family protein